MSAIVETYNPAETSLELQEQSALYAMLSVLERMQRNLLIINRDINAKQITVSNKTLFEVSADEYDDGTLWTYIAEVNDIEDPNNFIDPSIGFRTLLIPPKPTDNLRFGT